MMNRKKQKSIFKTVEKSPDFSTNDPVIEHVDRAGLSILGVRPSLPQYCRQLWARRHFIWASGSSQVLQKNRRLALGNAWMIISPFIDAAMYGVIFGLILQTSRGIENFLGYLVIGVIFMRFMTQGLSAGTGLISGSKNMIRSFTFPRAALAFSTIVRQLLENFAPALVAIVFALATQIGHPPTWRIVFILPLYLLLHLFALGMILIVARTVAFIPDLAQLFSVFRRGWFYVSGVFFSVERFDTFPLLQQIMIANPAYQFLQAFRGCVIYATLPSLGSFLYLSAWSFGTFLFGFWYFWRAEEKYINVQ
ncbi:ABC-2 type transporter [Corynebacterium faecale]|nr:ABC-2 type transporter [Corynebacterium faecale]